MGECIKNHYKKDCNYNKCCFECEEKHKCEYEHERCFQSEFYDYNISLGYPNICKLYRNV